MAAIFQLNWNISNTENDPNTSTQKALYKKRLDGAGAPFLDGIEGGLPFNPPNPISKNVSATQSGSLSDNAVYQFKIQTICGVNGPVDNMDGIFEAINFICIEPTATFTYNQATITIPVSGTPDIIKAKIKLTNTTTGVVLVNNVVVSASGSNITYTKTGLSPSTSYRWDITLGANVNSADKYSVTACAKSFITSPLPQCDSVTSLSAAAT